jgi:hypothetical protein
MKLGTLTAILFILFQNQAFATGDHGAPANHPNWFSWDAEKQTLFMNGGELKKGQECVYDLSYESYENGSCVVMMKSVSMTETPLKPWRKLHQYTQSGGGQFNIAGKILLFFVYLPTAAYDETSCMVDRFRFESMLNGLGLKCEAEDLAKAKRVLEENPYDQDTLQVWEEVKKQYPDFYKDN